MEDAVVRHQLVDVGKVAQGGHQQVAVGQGGSLGTPRGATRVEQPCRVVGLAADERRGRCRRQPVPPFAGSQHCRPQRGDRADERFHIVGMIVVGHDDCGFAVLEDVGDLVAVKARVDRYGHEPGVPDREQRLDVLRPIAHDDRDAVAGRQPEIVTKGRGGASGSGREGGPVGVDALAVGDGRRRRAAGARGAPPRQPRSSHYHRMR